MKLKRNWSDMSSQFRKDGKFMLKKILLKKISFKERLFLFLFTFLFLFIQIIGYNCSKVSSAKLSDIHTYLFLFLLPIFYFIFKVLFNFSYKCTEKNKIVSSKKWYLTCFFLIFLSWLPIMISFYPNNFAFDASTQVRMVIYDCISTYHPVIHTLFLGGLLKLSYLFFGTYTIGNFLYAIIQAVIMDVIFSYFLLFLVKEKAPTWLTILSLLLFMFLPTNSVLAITTTKDVIFSGLILLLVMKFYWIVTDKSYLKSRKNRIGMVVILFLSLAFRNNMVYALVLFFIPCILLLKDNRKQIGKLFLITLLVYGVYNVSLTKIFGVEKGPKVEAFSVVIQQFARVYHKEKLSKNDSSMIASLYKNDSLKRYNPQISDPVKSEFNSEVLFSNIKGYVQLYIKLGLKYPLTYIDSFLVNNYGYFYFFDKLPIDGTKTYIWVECMSKDKSFSCQDKCNDNAIYHLYNDLLEKATYQKVPILNIFMNIGFNIFILFFTMCLLIYRKKVVLGLPIYLLVSLFITNLLGPVALMRYVYPIFVCFPFMLFIINKTWSEKKNKEKESRES